LLWLVPLDWHDQLSSKWILSHSTWYKSRRSRQGVGLSSSSLLEDAQKQGLEL
jgi:hypothetical protein